MSQECERQEAGGRNSVFENLVREQIRFLGGVLCVSVLAVCSGARKEPLKKEVVP